MSNRKKASTKALSRASSVQSTAGDIAAREDRHRDECAACAAIFDADFRLINDTPGEPIHFQITVKPEPNESDAANYCTVLLDVMLTTASTPLLVVRKQKALGDAQVESLQQATNAEADRLLAKGEEAIIYSIVTFMQEWLIKYNHPTRSFHEQMVEREAREQAELELAAQEKRQATQQAVNQEKELLKRSIEAATRKKEELALKKQTELKKVGPLSTASIPSSRSISASPASLACSPSMLGSTPPFLPGLTLGAAASSSSAIAIPKKGGHSLLASPPTNIGTPAKKSATLKVPDSKGTKSSTSGGGGGGGGKSNREGVKHHGSELRMAERALDKKKSGKHKPRELRERSHDGMSESGSDDAVGSDDDDQSGDDDNDDDDEDDSGSDSDVRSSRFDPLAPSDDEESLFGTPSTSFDPKKGHGGMSDIDRLMAEIELKDRQKESKVDRTKAAANAKKKLQLNRASSSEGEWSGDEEEDEHDEESELSDDEASLSEEESEIDLAASPAMGSTVPAWLDRTSAHPDVPASSGSSVPHPAPMPALPYYSRFHSEFDQLGMLGKGGFGEVYKVRNKVDKLFYAVKRIKLKKKNPASNRKIVKEVSMIAMLHHRYIVRYYQAWIEGEEAVDDDPPKSDSTGAKKPDLQHRKSTTTKTEFNLAEDDEDWLSPSHPSTLGPKELEDSDSDDDDEDDDDSQPRPTSVQQGQQYLYVQMELCEHRTLRDVIDERVFESPEGIEECWRLFRQLLEAVAFIHKSNVMHRDLKPPNVFIALSEGVSQVKLGDFGLAVLSAPRPAAANNEADNANGITVPANQRSVSDLDAHALSRQDSVNECVGTHFYSAPEQSASGVSYDHRVDLFSLGIIFFEMVYPFNSLMERALQLEELRSTGKVPNEFLVGRPDRLNVIKIIESLVQPKPEDRPTAAELLQSGLIPLKIEDEFMEAALKSISTRDSAHHTRLLDILFSMPPDEHIDFTYDSMIFSSRSPANGNGQSLREPSHHFQQLVQMKVFDTVTNIFRNHGAIHMPTPIIAPKSTIGDTKTNTAVYMDPQGTIIKLPYTLTTPFARYVAQQSTWTWCGGSNGGDGSLDDIDPATDPDQHFDLRRYDIARVYRKNVVGGRPKELYECDFDIVWSTPLANQSAGSGALATSVGPHSSAFLPSTLHLVSKEASLAAREKLACLSAEVVKLTYEVLTEFVPAIGASFVIKVNHSDLFEAILDVVLADSNALAKAHKDGSTLSAASLQAQREDQALLRRDLCKLASSYALFQGSWSKSPMRRQLIREKKLSTKKIDLLGALFQLKSEPGKPDTIFQKIRDTFFSIPEARHVLNEAVIIEQLEFIKNVFSYLKLFHHVDAHVIFDIAICGKHDSYSHGIVFQALVPNTNTDLGVERPNMALDASTAAHSAFGSTRSEPITQNAFETIALGGQYDSLIASFMPPTSSVPLSAVGVNFAIDKIVKAVAAYQLKAPLKGTLNPTHIRRIKKSLYGADQSSTVLLFASKNAMLKERVALANDLWSDNLPCLYLHPAHLNHSTLRRYSKEHMIRWLVLFKRNEFREKNQVQIIDLFAATGRSTDKASKDQETTFLSVSEVASYLRARMVGKAAESTPTTASSHTSAAHVLRESHTKPMWHVHVVDASSIKSAAKVQILTQVKRCLNSVLATANPSTFAVCAADLPFGLIRSLTSAFYAGSSQLQQALEECHARQRVIGDQLVAYMIKKCGFIHLDTHPPTTSNKSTQKEKQAAALAAAAAEASKAERVEILYIYSIPDKKSDMILTS